MKALILAAGKGTRLKPVTDKICKPLLPLRGKPTILYILNELEKINIKEVGIVVSQENHDEILNFMRNEFKNNFKFHLIIQKEQLGVAHAVQSAQSFIGKDNFLLYLGDNLFEFGLSQVYQEFKKNNATTIALKQVKDASRFGVAIINGGNLVMKIVEKPKNPPSKYAVTGIYCFTNEIFKSIEKINLSQRGEYEITDAIQSLILEGKKVYSKIIDGWWIDTGNLNDFLKANREIYTNTSSNRSNFSGSGLDKTVFIGANVNIKQSKINDFSSIGSNSIIENSSINNSVVMEGSVLKNVNIVNCIIGPNSKIINIEPQMKKIESEII
ncbi:MAG: glucose-1-phosphate thymidylyltransferase [Chloroflexi bacterium]|nr:glucose-1-phosphate thymidylyltransferase [Chloroflexota bacterium]